MAAPHSGQKRASEAKAVPQTGQEAPKVGNDNVEGLSSGIWESCSIRDGGTGSGTVAPHFGQKRAPGTEAVPQAGQKVPVACGGM